MLKFKKKTNILSILKKNKNYDWYTKNFLKIRVYKNNNNFSEKKKILILKQISKFKNIFKNSIFKYKIWELLNKKYRKFYKLNFFFKLFIKIFKQNQFNFKTWNFLFLKIRKLNFISKKLHITKSHLRNFCIISKKPKAVKTLFKFSRIILKKFTNSGKISGLQKSSW